MKFELDTFNRNVPDSDLLEDLVAAHAKLMAVGKALTYRSYREHGLYSPSTINDRFGSWNHALRQAGLVPIEEKNVSTEVLFNNLREVWITKGKQPVYRDMAVPPSLYTGSTYGARFGSWRKALKEFVTAVSQEQQEFLQNGAPNQPTKIATRAKRDPSLALRFAVLKRDSFRCVACGRSPATETGLILEVDHILPWSKGGETTLANLQSLCYPCNRGKSTT